MAVVEQLEGPVRAHGDGVNLKCQTRGINLKIDVPGFLRFVHGTGKHAYPLMHDFRDALAHLALPAVKFKGGGTEETPARENTLLNESQPVVHEAPKARHSLTRTNGRFRNFFDKNLASLRHRRQLKLFLRAEVGKKTTLAHFQLFSERTDGESLKTLDGSDINGPDEDYVTGAQPAGLPAVNTFLARSARGLGHFYNTIPRQNK